MKRTTRPVTTWPLRWPGCAIRSRIGWLIYVMLHPRKIRVIYQHDLFTEVLPEEQFLKLRNLLMGLVNEISTA